MGTWAPQNVTIEVRARIGDGVWGPPKRIDIGKHYIVAVAGVDTDFSSLPMAEAIMLERAAMTNAVAVGLIHAGVAALRAVARWAAEQMVEQDVA